MVNIIEPKTYIYKKILSRDTSISLPKIDKHIAKEYRPTIVYIDKVYTNRELLDKYSEEVIDVNGEHHLIQGDPYETRLVYDEYCNFDELIKKLGCKDYIALDKFTDFSWDWSSLVYRLSLLWEKGATFSAYGIYFDYPKDLLDVMQLGEKYSLPFKEKSIKDLLKIYYPYHSGEEFMRSIKPMESYPMSEVIKYSNDQNFIDKEESKI